MLAAVNRNHHMVMVGATRRSPLVRMALRVFVFSYVILARANRAEEQIPWANIIVRVAFQAHRDEVIEALIIIPI